MSYTIIMKKLMKASEELAIFGKFSRIINLKFLFLNRGVCFRVHQIDWIVPLTFEFNSRRNGIIDTNWWPKWVCPTIDGKGQI